MNLEGLCRVLGKYLGAEVVVGPKRGAFAQKDHVPAPIDEMQVRATLVVQNVDSPGKPHLRRELNTQINRLVEIVTTEQNAICGLRLEAYKGADDYSWGALSTFRTKMALPSFKRDLRDEGFALADTGRVVRLNSQAADVAFLEFTVTFSEIISSDPELAFIDNADISSTLTGPFKAS